MGLFSIFWLGAEPRVPAKAGSIRRGYRVHARRQTPSRSNGALGYGSGLRRDDGRGFALPLCLHLLDFHILPTRLPRRDVAAGEAGLALRHLLLRAAQGFPPRRAVRRARQRRVDDFLDLLEAQHEFGKRLLLQVIAQRVVIVHVYPRWWNGLRPICRLRDIGPVPATKRELIAASLSPLKPRETTGGASKGAGA